MNLWSNPPSVNSMTPSQNQNFSLPNDAILYILNNCNSSEALQKLLQTCKYFLMKKKIAIINEPVFYFLFQQMDIKKEEFYYKKNEKNRKDLNIYEKQIYWLTNSLRVRTYIPPNYFSSIYRCNLKILILDNQTLNFDEISFLLNGKNIEKLEIDVCIIRYKNGSPVTTDAILEQCPRIIDLYYMNVPDNFSVEIMEKLNSLKFINMLDRLYYGIFHLENDFYKQALELLCQFIRKNVKPKEDQSSCVWVLLLEGFYDYQIEFSQYFKQNLNGWNVTTGLYASHNSRREADLNKKINNLQ